MNRSAPPNGQALPSEDHDLEQLFAENCPRFEGVNLASLVGREATNKTVNRTCAPFTSPIDSVSNPLWKRRSFMLKSLGVLGGCAASIAMAIVFSPIGSSSAFAQVQESLKSVRSASYTVTISSESKTPLRWRVYLSDSGVCRLEQPSGVYLVFDSAKKKLMEVNPAESKARITEGLNVPEGFNVIAQLSRSELKISPESENHQVKNIGAVTAKGFTVKDKQASFSIWVNPDNDLPVLVEKFSAGNELHLIETWSDFEYNVQLDESLFSFEVPEGYRSEFVRATKNDDTAKTDVQQEPESTRREGPSYGFGPKSK